MRGLGTDCVIAEPMRGLKNAFNGANRKTDTQTEGHGDSDSMTESAKSGRFSGNYSFNIYCKKGSRIG